MKRFYLASPIAAVAILVLLGGSSIAQERSQTVTEPVHRVPATQQQATLQTVATGDPAPAAEHPLMPALRIANAGMAKIDSTIKDYSATLVKQERIDGKMSDQQYIFLKVRHEPFSVYMYFLGPADVKGRECIYVATQGKLIAHEGKGLTSALGTFRLDPTGTLAMRGQKYPITEVGVRTLTSRLIEVAQHDIKFQECDVKFFQGAKIDNRPATMLHVEHPTPRKEFRFNIARVFIDDELQIPVRYEAYLWPSKPGGQPILDEVYTYTNIKINNGFTDEDFSETNRDYSFK